jgi:hypothetical protein
VGKISSTFADGFPVFTGSLGAARIAQIDLFFHSVCYKIKLFLPGLKHLLRNILPREPELLLKINRL